MSSPDLEDAQRLLTLDTPLGPGALLVRAVTGEEAISRLFSFELELASPRRSIPPEALLGEPVSLGLRLASGARRHWHGIVSRLEWAGRDAEGLTAYRCQVVPALWRAGLGADCRIFQGQSALEIASDLLGDAGAEVDASGVRGGGRRRDCCVQYGESALAFAQRLLEDEGIYYYFDHREGRARLILGDDPAHHPPCPGQPTLQRTDRPGFSEDRLLSARILEEVHAGQVALTDYDFRSPAADLGRALAGRWPFEDFQYPGGYDSGADGEARARIRLEAHGCLARRLEGESDARALAAGHRFTLEGVPREAGAGGWVVYSLRHQARQPLTEADEGAATYRNQLVAFPHRAAFRPPRVTPRPRIPGAQTAVVVGRPGEALWTDEHGRVRVQFHWDRYGQGGEAASAWIRVAQGWAGQQWGMIFTPRVGQEVVVEFLDGDPDRPLITGRVYNGQAAPPWPLPARQALSGIKTESLGGGGSNELRFDDTRHREEVYLHAQRALTEEVGRDHRTAVGGDRLSRVEGSHTETVGQDQRLEVSGGVTTTVGQDQRLEVGGYRSITVTQGQGGWIGGDHGEEVGGDETLTVRGARHRRVLGAQDALDVDRGDRRVTVHRGEDLLRILTGGRRVDAQGDHWITTQVGSNVLTAAQGDARVEAPEGVVTHAGREVVVVADQAITLQVGLMSITLEREAITLSGVGGKIRLDPGGVSVSGGTIKSAATGIQEITGAIVKIN